MMKTFVLKVRIYFDDKEDCDVGIFEISLPDNMDRYSFIDKMKEYHQKLIDYSNDEITDEEYDDYELYGRNPYTLIKFTCNKLNIYYRVVNYDEYVEL